MQSVFETRVLEADWNANEKQHYGLVFGDQSQLVGNLYACQKEPLLFESVADGIVLLLKKSPELLLGSHDEATPSEIEAGVKILYGLESLLRAASLWRTKRISIDSTNFTGLFATAAANFSAAWAPADEATLQWANDAGWESCLGTDALWQAIRFFKSQSPIGGVIKPTGFWSAFDLLARLLPQSPERDPESDSQNVRQIPSFREATTPILMAGDEPAVMWLTVELTDHGIGAFCPDLLGLGLTSIGDPSSVSIRGPKEDLNEDQSLAASMQKAWRRSGLGSRWRGRWRITTACPKKIDRFKREMPLYLPKISGPSAEAATLAALWAAAGVVPYAEPFGSTEDGPLELALDVAVSAELGAEQKVSTDTELKPVGAVADKIRAAEALGLDLVLFAEDSEERNVAAKTQSQRADEAKKKVNRSLQDLRPMVEHVATIGAALDTMLVTNRHLKKYQAAVAEQWLSQWEPGTAEFKP